MSLVLESRVGGIFMPHPEGIHPAVCVDVIDLGLVETEWQGQRRLVRKVRLVFETEQRNEEGKRCMVTKTFTASLHPQAKLPEFLGKWRGRPVLPGESIDLAKLVAACCTLVISHQQNMAGRIYASIDAVSKPTQRVVASGEYDPALARQRIAEWKAKEAGANPNTEARNPREVRSPKSEREGAVAINPVSAAFASLAPAHSAHSGPSPAANSFRPLPGDSSPQAAGSGRLGEASLPGPKSAAPGASRTGQQAPEPEFDPDVGF